MIWATMSSAAVGPLCFLKSTVNAAILPGHFRALHASFCWQALWRCWFHFPAWLGTCPHCQRYQKLVQWPWCYCAWLASKLVLTWNPLRICGIVKRKMRDTRPNNADDLKAAIKATWASITPEQCHRLIASMPRRIDAAINAKGGPIECIEMNTLFRSLTFLFKIFFLNNFYSSDIQIFWDTEFWVFIICKP